MITISDSDARKLMNICAEFSDNLKASARLKDRNKGRVSRQLSKKLKKKLPCFMR